MCGIVGYVGGKPASDILFDGLRSLEYRGYDSAGIAVLTPHGQIDVRKVEGKLSRLFEVVGADRPSGVIGLGHTRWATHGRPSEINAHPHLDCGGDLVVIHNGIVENYLTLRASLRRRGHTLISETDSEVIPHLVEEHLKSSGNLECAVRRTLQELEGSEAVVVLSRREPDRIIAARLGNAGGVVIGYGDGEMFAASDLPAILPYTRRVAFLDDQEMAIVTADRVAYSRTDGSQIEKQARVLPYDRVTAEKGGYRHFFLKEVHEQAQAIADTLGGRVCLNPPAVKLETGLDEPKISEIDRVLILGMGSSMYAAQYGKLVFEDLARIPAEVDHASEFRYRNPVLDERTLVISISQSGETADTLAAMAEARRRGCKLFTICNTIGAQTTRVADYVFLTRAGLEVGVCSSKSFTTQLVALYLLALDFGRARGALDEPCLRQRLAELAELPHAMGRAIAMTQEKVSGLARKLFRTEHFLYIGRWVNYPIAMEGALKLKEMSYIHAEGYSAGDLKHGPISLIDGNMPVVAIAPGDHTYAKILSNIKEVKARGARVIAVCEEGDSALTAEARDVLEVPRVANLLSPVINVVPLQLLAYHIALRRGCDVDQPRNLAKSVTVE
jgi:glucosamine--fructose-6-phosphate aminotransferase (isomerizing)